MAPVSAKTDTDEETPTLKGAQGTHAMLDVLEELSRLNFGSDQARAITEKLAAVRAGLPARKDDDEDSAAA